MIVVSAKIQPFVSLVSRDSFKAIISALQNRFACTKNKLLFQTVCVKSAPVSVPVVATVRNAHLVLLGKFYSTGPVSFSVQ